MYVGGAQFYSDLFIYLFQLFIYLFIKHLSSAKTFFINITLQNISILTEITVSAAY